MSSFQELGSKLCDKVVALESEVEALRTQLTAARESLAAIDTYVRSVHNGYSEDARKAMAPNLKEPASTLEAIRELVEENDELAGYAAGVQLREMESQTTALRSAAEAILLLASDAIRTVNSCGDFAGGHPVLQSPELQIVISSFVERLAAVKTALESK